MASSTEPAPRVDVAPFDLPGRGRAAALCLHGLTGTPYEVRPLAEALSRSGIRALGPALPGHNQTPAQLARTSHGDWLDAAREHLHSLRGRHDRVFIVGVSLGGLLGLALAAEEPVDAAVVVGTPLRFSLALSALVPLLSLFVPYAKKRGGSDIRDPAARSRHPSYDVMPLASVAELIRLQRLVRRRLARVNAPILIAHGAHDRTARPSDARSIHASVGSAERQMLVLEASAHVATVDFDGALLARATAGFLSRFA
ncbi:MAG TPA: alpha/beta fold hydrolase [Myxococcota bacterium]